MSGEPERDVYVEIRAERAAQDKKWGGPEHDDKHIEWQWMRMIDIRLHLAAGREWRRRMIQVAALAIAAVEARDRETARRGE